VEVHLGRFGPYVKCGKATVSLPKDRDPSTVEYADALAFITDAKQRRKEAAEPLRTLGKDPSTGAEILVKSGRYGPYVTDGKTNASLSKKLTPESVTLEEASDLLAKKRVRGPSKWHRRR
jgi:DNA topoisomerase-1